MGLKLRSLIGKLSDATRLVMEAAAGDTDFALIASHFGIDKPSLSGELTCMSDHLKSGNARRPALSPSLLKMMTGCRTVGSIDFGADGVRSGLTVLALLTDEQLAGLVSEMGREMQKILAWIAEGEKSESVQVGLGEDAGFSYIFKDSTNWRTPLACHAN